METKLLGLDLHNKKPCVQFTWTRSHAASFHELRFNSHGPRHMRLWFEGSLVRLLLACLSGDLSSKHVRPVLAKQTFVSFLSHAAAEKLTNIACLLSCTCTNWSSKN
eukprot:1157396-Pelagomonas_calceolata.AAC.11